MTHEKTHTGECGIKGDQSFENREGAHAGEIPNVGAKCEKKFCQADKEKSVETCVKGLVNHEKEHLLESVGSKRMESMPVQCVTIALRAMKVHTLEKNFTFVQNVKRVFQIHVN